MGQTDHDRRQHRRLDIRLPLECCEIDGQKTGLHRSVTTNISTGGLFFEAELTNGSEPPLPRSLLTVELTVPPGEGHSPYEGQVRSVAEVLRCDVLEAATGSGPRRLGVAARFREPLKLAF